MEIKEKIARKHYNRGYYINLECCMCYQAVTLAEDSEEQLEATIEEQGWTYLKSDEFGSEGYYCGCDYSNEN